jgi:hypothetical protein
MEVGAKAQGQGKNAEAAELYSKAYDLYSLFWGINMGLVNLDGVQKDENIPKPLKEWMGDVAVKSDTPKAAPAKAAAAPAAAVIPASGSGMMKGLGAWVRKSVNCCLE